jgi:hypothetical protein
MRMRKMIDVQVEDIDGDRCGDDEYQDGIEMLEAVLQLVAEEYMTACHLFPPFRSAHEGVAIIDEEWQEFKAAAYWPHKEDTGDEADEARQLTAMVVRYLTDVVYAEKEVPR